MPLVLACSRKLMVCLISSVFSGTRSAVSLMLSNSEQILERGDQQFSKWGDLKHKEADLVGERQSKWLTAYCPLWGSWSSSPGASRRSSWLCGPVPVSALRSPDGPFGRRLSTGGWQSLLTQPWTPRHAAWHSEGHAFDRQFSENETETYACSVWNTANSRASPWCTRQTNGPLP